MQDEKIQCVLVLAGRDVELLGGVGFQFASCHYQESSLLQAE